MLTSRMLSVQDPIIPIVGTWTRDSPGTISLGQGIVSYPPPPEVFEAIASPDTMVNLYQEVQGLRSLRSAIAHKLEKENNILLQGLHQIVVTAGSNMGFMNAVLAITQPGDEVILQSPYYFNHEMAIKMAGCLPVCVETSDSYQLNLAAISQAITFRTKAIVTVSPNNPTGAVYPSQDLMAINQICRDRSLYHISDEAYEYFLYDGCSHCSPAQFDPNSRHTISLFSLSKAYGFAGWRIGYMVIPECLQVPIQKIQDTILICPPVISQVAALAALEVGKAYPEKALQTLNQTRDAILNRLHPIAQKCRIIKPDGAFYLFLKINSSRSAMSLVKSLIQKHQVAVIPGSAFGYHQGCYLRVAYGALDSNTINQGIQRLVEGLTDLI